MTTQNRQKKNKKKLKNNNVLYWLTLNVLIIYNVLSTMWSILSIQNIIIHLFITHTHTHIYIYIQKKYNFNLNRSYRKTVYMYCNWMEKDLCIVSCQVNIYKLYTSRLTNTGTFFEAAKLKLVQLPCSSFQSSNQHMVLLHSSWTWQVCPVPHTDWPRQLWTSVLRSVSYIPLSVSVHPHYMWHCTRTTAQTPN